MASQLPLRRPPGRATSVARRTTWSTAASNKVCHICGKPGHLKKDCPDAALADSMGDLEVAPKARTKRTMCYNCGQVGHVSADCTMARQEGATFRKCFNCGKPGHLSADCPQPQGNQNCYECGQPGHKARDCPNVQ